MKKLILLIVAAMLIGCVGIGPKEMTVKELMEKASETGADQKLTALTNLETAYANADEFYIVDASGPTSMALDGRRSKQFELNSYSSDQTLTAAAHAGTIVQITAPSDMTMWSCDDTAGSSYSIGDWVIFWIRDAEIGSAVPASGESFQLIDGASPLTANYELDMPASGNEAIGTKVTLMCVSDGTWYVWSQTADCGDGGAAD